MKSEALVVRRIARTCCWMVMLMPAWGLAAERQPNIVVLFADDLGYGELGCQGNAEIPTPHIDSIVIYNTGFRILVIRLMLSLNFLGQIQIDVA